MHRVQLPRSLSTNSLLTFCGFRSDCIHCSPPWFIVRHVHITQSGSQVPGLVPSAFHIPRLSFLLFHPDPRCNSSPSLTIPFGREAVELKFQIQTTVVRYRTFMRELTGCDNKAPLFVPPTTTSARILFLGIHVLYEISDSAPRQWMIYTCQSVVHRVAMAHEHGCFR